MMRDGEDVLRAAAEAAHASGLQCNVAAWDFQWVKDGAAEQWAQVTGQLRWRGFDIAFSMDGLMGVDGRLAAPSLATIPPDLQHLVLQHFAGECLQELQGGPLADITLVSLQWHEDPLPMEGEFEFTLKRAELSLFSRGRLKVFDAAGRRELLNTLASLRWPVPHGLSTVYGLLQIGSAHLSAEECAALEVGDLVWLDDAEVAPMGLRAQFLPTQEVDAACLVWVKRSTLSRPLAVQQAAPLREQARSRPGVLLKATSFEMAVQRGWLQGGMAQQSMAKTALALTWQLCDDGRTRFEGQLLVVGRRLGLRVTQLL